MMEICLVDLQYLVKVSSPVTSGKGLGGRFLQRPCAGVEGALASVSEKAVLLVATLMGYHNFWSWSYGSEVALLVIGVYSLYTETSRLVTAE